jgi:hypothetical protein
MKASRLAASALGLATALGGTTLLALEGNEVVVLRTMDASGSPHRTRTWIVDADGFAWIEAANPERPFLDDLRARPQVELERGDGVRRCDAMVLPNPDGHTRIRRLLADKYGWADDWIGVLADTSQSVAIRLACR